MLFRSATGRRASGADRAVPAPEEGSPSAWLGLLLPHRGAPPGRCRRRLFRFTMTDRRGGCFAGLADPTSRRRGRHIHRLLVEWSRCSCSTRPQPAAHSTQNARAGLAPARSCATAYPAPWPARGRHGPTPAAAPGPPAPALLRVLGSMCSCSLPCWPSAPQSPPGPPRPQALDAGWCCGDPCHGRRHEGRPDAPAARAPDRSAAMSRPGRATGGLAAPSPIGRPWPVLWRGPHWPRRPSVPGAGPPPPRPLSTAWPPALAPVDGCRQVDVSRHQLRPPPTRRPPRRHHPTSPT